MHERMRIDYWNDGWRSLTFRSFSVLGYPPTVYILVADADFCDAAQSESDLAKKTTRWGR